MAITAAKINNEMAKISKKSNQEKKIKISVAA
jgi:hypothetical protein